MRAYNRFNRKRGFTLVELMIVVAIIGVLAALAIYGVRRYLTSARTSEAKNTIGAITRASVQAYEKENQGAELLTEGSSGTTVNHELCDSATPVPGTVPAGTKYQPDTAADQDFDTDDANTGWRCLKFQVNEPIYYQYHYERAAITDPGSGSFTQTNGGAADWFSAVAIGDLDGDTVESGFARVGAITGSNELKVSTKVEALFEDE